jgi:hypothetical protein
MSDYFLAYPQAFLAAASITPENETTENPIDNALTGGSAQYWEGTGAGAGMYAQFNLPASTAFDVAIIKGAKSGIARGAGTALAKVQSSAAADFSSPTQRGITTAAASFDGPDGDDIVLTFTEASARYWRLSLIYDVTTVHRVRKAYLCKRFDFGRAPAFPFSQGAAPMSAGFISDSGNVFKTYRGRPARSFSMSWRGLSDATIKDFKTKIGRYVDLFPVFVVEPPSSANADFYPFGGERCACCWITGISISSELNNNSLDLSLVEDIAQ